MDNIRAVAMLGALAVLALPACSAAPFGPSDTETACVDLAAIINDKVGDFEEITEYASSVDYVGEAMNERMWATFDEMVAELSQVPVPDEIAVERRNLVASVEEVTTRGRVETAAASSTDSRWSEHGAITPASQLPELVDTMVDAAFALDAKCDDLIIG